MALNRDRDRQLDSAYIANLAGDTANPVLLSAWRREKAMRRVAAHRDSLLLARMVRSPKDTAYDPYNESQAAIGMALWGSILGVFTAVLSPSILLTLVGFTVWWAFRRRRARTPQAETL